MADIDTNLHNEADSRKANLNSGVADRVPRGDEANPLKVDPFAARKAMFQKADKLRGGIDTTGGDVDPELVAQMEAEARGEVLDPNTRKTQPISNNDTHQTIPLQVDGEYVTIPVEGGQPIKVAKRDVDRAGGVPNYLLRRSLDEEKAQLARDRAETQRLRTSLAESQRPPAASQDGSAHGTGQPPVQDRNGPGATGAVELKDKARRLARQIYSGDEGDAEKAILEILTTSQDRGETLTEGQIRDRVDATRTTQATPQPKPVVTNPSVDAINRSIDEMAIAEYNDICSDEPARAATFAKFVQLVKLPENRDRRAVDVARDACEWGRKTLLADPRQHVVEAKRGLPSSTTASSVPNQESDDNRAPLTPAEIIAQQQQHRQFGRRPQ